MEQQYENYTTENHRVWEILFSRQQAVIDEVATSAYFEGLERVNFPKDRVPNFADINRCLAQYTGWEVVPVKGIVDDDKFFELLSKKQFPATTWIRSMEQLDYLEEPDMFHDVFGHVPLLAEPFFVEFLQGLSQIALNYLEDPKAVHLLSRIYWFTVEFGLIEERGRKRIYGAGILSSPGETVHSLSEAPTHHTFDVRQILETAYRKDIFQTNYFIIDSFEALAAALPEVEIALTKMLEDKTSVVS